MADAAAGRRDQALEALQQALLLAMPEGYARIFLDEGAPMAELLRQAAARGIAPNYVQELLDALYKTIHDEWGTMKEVSTVHRSSLIVQPLVEPLSERELEVLRMIASGASNQAIAASLVISIGTVKSHINHILAKLAASNRTEAASRARELGLLAA